jgi:uncharacterized membrane protein
MKKIKMNNKERSIMINNRALILFSSLPMIMAPLSAHAYIGLGPGMTMIGSFFSLIIGVLIVVGMIFILPMRMMLKKRKAKKKADAISNKTDGSSGQ